MMLLVFLTCFIIIQRLSELAVSKRNYKWALQQGGREYGADHYWLFVVLHTLWIGAFNLEWLLLKPTIPKLWPFLLLLILVAQVIRYWAISTLGRRWNTRIVVIKDLPLVKSGPYRFFKHPNYLAVILDIAAIPAFIGAWNTAIIFSIVNGVLLFFIRIPDEERALKEFSEFKDNSAA